MAWRNPLFRLMQFPAAFAFLQADFAVCGGVAVLGFTQNGVFGDVCAKQFYSRFVGGLNAVNGERVVVGVVEFDLGDIKHLHAFFEQEGVACACGRFAAVSIGVVAYHRGVGLGVGG